MVLNDGGEDLSQLKLPALKELCRQRKLKVTGTKAVLLGRLTELSQTHTSKNTQEVDRIHLPKHKAVASCSEFIDRETRPVNVRISRPSDLPRQPLRRLYEDAPTHTHITRTSPAEHDRIPSGPKRTLPLFTNESILVNNAASRSKERYCAIPSASTQVERTPPNHTGDASGTDCAGGRRVLDRAGDGVLDARQDEDRSKSNSSAVLEISSTSRKQHALKTTSVMKSVQSIQTPIFSMAKAPCSIATRKFVTPLRNPKKFIEKPLHSSIQTPSFERHASWDYFELQLDWFQVVTNKLVEHLNLESQQQFHRINVKFIDHDFLVSLGGSVDTAEKATTCLRFLIARLYNKLSTMEDEGCSLLSVLSMSSVVKSEEVAPGLSRAILSSQEMFYFLSKTGEIIGSGSPTLHPVPSEGRYLRADWEHFVDGHLECLSRSEIDLFNCVRTCDFDTYPHGISQIYLASCKDEELIDLAVTYVLANLSPNSTSGRWRSIFDSCAEFNAIHIPSEEKMTTKSELAMFLPSAHYVEKVYRTAEDGKSLHEAICAIQTARRTHLCLRMTGQIIGNDEEGLVALWGELLGCDERGVRSK